MFWVLPVSPTYLGKMGIGRSHPHLHPGDGVFGFHQGSSEGGRRFVCYFDVVASRVSG